MTDRVRIYEVGPRDGLQNESVAIPLDTKVEFIERLATAGLLEIEATSFVSPRAIPQLADADALLPRLSHTPGVRYPVLVPNERGMARAEAAGAKALAVFTAATDAFTERNIGMTIEESLAAFEPVLRRARGPGLVAPGVRLDRLRLPLHRRGRPARPRWPSRRGSSTSAPTRSASATRSGSACRARSTVLTGAAVGAGIRLDQIAFHFHDTRGTALANVQAGLDAGIRCFDSSTGGTGGCPYAPGAAGNLATEDLVYLLDASGFEHGVDLEGVLDAARFITSALGKPLASKVGQAGGWDAATGQRLA